MTALHRATSRGLKQIVKILVEYGSNVALQAQVFSFSFFFILIYIYFVFVLFLTTFFFVKGWMDRSSLSC